MRKSPSGTIQVQKIQQARQQTLILAGLSNPIEKPMTYDLS
jgi:hypothetical protein